MSNSIRAKAVFAEWLHDQRVKRKWTQKDVAEKSGVKIVSYANYERARYMPPISVAKKLAKAFGMTLDQFAEVIE